MIKNDEDNVRNEGQDVGLQLVTNSLLRIKEQFDYFLETVGDSPLITSDLKIVNVLSELRRQSDYVWMIVADLQLTVQDLKKVGILPVFKESLNYFLKIVKDLPFIVSGLKLVLEVFEWKIDTREQQESTRKAIDSLRKTVREISEANTTSTSEESEISEE